MTGALDLDLVALRFGVEVRRHGDAIAADGLLERFRRRLAESRRVRSTWTPRSIACRASRSISRDTRTITASDRR